MDKFKIQLVSVSVSGWISGDCKEASFSKIALANRTSQREKADLH